MTDNKKDERKISIILLIIADKLNKNEISDVEASLLITLENIQGINDTFIFDDLEKRHRLHISAMFIKDFMKDVMDKWTYYEYKNAIDILDKYILVTNKFPVPRVKNKKKLKHCCLYDFKNMKVCTAKSSMNIFKHEKTQNRTKEQMAYKIIQSIYISTPNYIDEKYLYFDIAEYYKRFYGKKLDTDTRKNYEKLFEELFNNSNIQKHICDGILLHDIKGMFIGVIFKVFVNRSSQTKFPINYFKSLDLNKSLEVNILFLIHRLYIYAIKNYNNVTIINISKDIIGNIPYDLNLDIKNYSKNYKRIYDKTIYVLNNLKNNKYDDAYNLIDNFFIINSTGVDAENIKIVWENRT